MIGISLGPYKILEKIGAGGMGEVFLAEDTRLNRKVAVKTLPEEFASDPERLARFEQEAKAAAALNHPHIAVVHDIGCDEGIHYIVQEYLEGDTLREPLKKGPLPMGKALLLAREIAEALAAAHGAGIVHRDLKPDNIFITSEGHAKILDFGLAKLTELANAGGAELSMSPTVLGTVAGRVMGTAGYMSPEQVEGEGEIDGRADIFAFGCLLYEMTTGQRAFAGKSVLDTLHAIARTEPQPIGDIKADAPADLERILRKCLAKERADRYQHAEDLLVDLRGLSKDFDAGTARTLADRAADAADVAAPRRSPVPTAAAAFVVGAVLAALAVGYALFPETLQPQPLMRFEVRLPDDMRVTVLQGPMAFSPDGSALVMSLVSTSNATRTLWVRGFDGEELRELDGTEGADRPFFSPDGRWIAFFTGNQLRKVSLDGGPSLPITTFAGGAAAGGSWGHDDNIVFTVAPVGIFTVPGSSGDPELLIGPDEAAGRLFFGNPNHVGDSGSVLFQYMGSDFTSGIAVVSLETGDARNLYAPAEQPLYLNTGHLAYVVDGTLFVAPFDADRLEITGDPTPLETDFYVSGGTSGVSTSHLAVSSHGTLVFFDTGGGTPTSELVWRSLDGAIERIATPQRQGSFFFPTLSPDNTHVAYIVWDEGTSAHSTMIMDLERRMAQQVFSGYHAEWSPDGEDLYVTNDNIGDLDIYRISADGGGDPEPILVRPLLQIPRDISPDGEWMLVAETPAAQSTEYDILVMSLTEGGEPQPLFADPELNELNAVFSPDGRWVAWTSAERGAPPEVYVTSFPSIGGRIQISEGGGDEPVWSPDGTRLFFRNGQQAYVVDVDTRDGFEHSRPRPLFRGGFQNGVQQSGAFDVSSDGDRLLMFAYADADGASQSTFLTQMNVVVNWFEAVRATGQGR